MTSQQQIERLIEKRQVQGATLKLRMTLTAENASLNHVVERGIEIGKAPE